MKTFIQRVVKRCRKSKGEELMYDSFKNEFTCYALENGVALHSGLHTFDVDLATFEMPLEATLSQAGFLRLPETAMNAHYLLDSNNNPIALVRVSNKVQFLVLENHHKELMDLFNEVDCLVSPRMGL